MKQADKECAGSLARFSMQGWKLTCASLVLITAAGCGGDDGGGGGSDTPVDASTGGTKADAGTGAKPDAGSTGGGDTVAIAAGKVLATQYICTSCHGTNYAGAGYYPNITPDDDTGIGTWTDEQIADAFNNGVDDEGKMLCAEMARYGLDDTDSANLVAFLKSLPAKSNKITQECK